MGAQKAGTSWLHYILQDTPELSFPPVKEVHYFDRIHMSTKALDRRRKAVAEELIVKNPEQVKRFNKEETLSENDSLNKKLIFAFGEIGDNWYSSLFNRESIATDITPAYAILPESGFRHISEIASNVKILFVMRDPVDRMLSHVRYKFNEDLKIYQGRKPKQIEEADTNELKEILYRRGVVARSNYPETIKNLYNVFSIEDVKLIFYDLLREKPDKFIIEVCQFIGVKSAVADSELLKKRINATKEFKFPNEVKKEAMEICRPIVEELKNILPKIPESWLHSVDL